MATDPTLDIASIARNPDSEFSLEAQGKSFPTVGLNNDEASKLESQLNEFLLQMNNSTLRNLISKRADAISLAAAFSKQVFDEKLFGGINAGDNEIGFDVLRPGHIRADPSTGNPENTWNYEPSSTGWNDWIGDGGSNNKTFNDDQVVLVLGMVDQDGPQTALSGVNVDSFGRNVDMLPQDLNDMRLKDNDTDLQIKSFPTLIGQENDSAHIRLRYDAVEQSQPRLFGFTFGLGSYLNTEDY